MGLINNLLNLAYPAACGICGVKLSGIPEEAASMCDSCLTGVKRNPAPYCKTCGRSLRGAAESVDICWECRGRRFNYERSWSCFLYEGAAREMLHLLKYSKKFSLSDTFCGLFVRFMRDNPLIAADVDAVLAVPLYHTKLREREFNQARLLAEAAAKEFGFSDLSACLNRIASTRPQSELDRAQRLENVKNTFRAKNGFLLKGKNMLLVDDLFTTGATMNECAGVLKEAGANKIHCLTFARGA